MFASIAAFEFRYQLRNPVFWFVSTLFFLLTFGAVASENVQIGSGGNVNVNSPGAISLTMLVLTIFFMFVTTAFVANVIVRDDDSGFGPMVRSTRVSKFDYLIGRFTGAFGISAFSFLSVPLAILIGSAMPWIDPETVGPTRLSYYAVPYLVFALPGIFLTSALFFKAHARYLKTHIADLLCCFACTHGFQQPAHRIKCALGIGIGKPLFMGELVALFQQLIHPGALGPAKHILERIHPEDIHHLKK